MTVDDLWHEVMAVLGVLSVLLLLISAARRTVGRIRHPDDFDGPGEPDPLEPSGTPPDLAGRVCHAFLCEGVRDGDTPLDTANVVTLHVGDGWHRLSIDGGTVYWRLHDGPTPTAWADARTGLSYPVVDVGAAAGLVGLRLVRVQTEPTDAGARVTFTFETGRTVTIDNAADRTDYHVS